MEIFLWDEDEKAGRVPLYSAPDAAAREHCHGMHVRRQPISEGDLL